MEKRRGVGMFVTDQAAQKLLTAERARFLTEEWPQVLERIRQLGLDPAQLIANDQQRFGANSHD